MAKTIFSKYSNERQSKFQIRTDIVLSDGVKKVRKYALTEDTKAHLIHIDEMYHGLSKNFQTPNKVFSETVLKEHYIESVFAEGQSLQELMETAAAQGNEDAVTTFVKEYIAWVKADGGNKPFVMTNEFREVFGDAVLPDGLLCAEDTDIDLIFSNIIVKNGIWNMIDYEWTFSFPIPKHFVLYRALFLAHHQIKRCAALELNHLYELAQLTKEEIVVYEQMEKHFQEYVRGGSYPIRDMYKKTGTAAVWFHEIDKWRKDMSVRGAGMGTNQSIVKQINYHIDRMEYNQGHAICCGWAFALTKDGTYFPVEIELTDSENKKIETPLTRNVRPDVAQALKITDAKDAAWGFNYVWATEEARTYYITFSLNGTKAVHEITENELARSYREHRRRYPSQEAMKRDKDKMRDKDDWHYLRTGGLRALRDIQKQRLNKKDVPYAIWRKYQVPGEEELKRQRKTSFAYEPVISIIVPAYRTPEKFLREMIQSVQKQSYQKWELCIADGSLNDSISSILEEYAKKDARIKYKLLDENYGISGNTNKALSIASGDYIGLLDHDDILEVDALFEVVRAINEQNAEVLYTDEDKVSLDLSEYFDPHFKPDYNPDYLKSCNYICHFFVVKTSVVKKAGQFDSSCDGSQDYDFILRCIASASKTVHIPKILYHWRCHPNSTAMNPESKLYCYEAGKRAIKRALEASGETKAQVILGKNYGMYEVYYPLETEPLISVITTERMAVWEAISLSQYSEIEIVECGNSYTPKNVNSAVKRALGKYCIFLPNLEGFQKADWLKVLLSNIQRKEVGIVCPKVLGAGKQILSAGMVLGLNGTAHALFAGNGAEEAGYFCRAITQQCVSAAALHGMVIEKALFLENGGFSSNLTITQGALELCLKMHKAEKYVVFTPYAVIYAKDDLYAPRKIDIEESEFLQTYGDIIKQDKFYSPNFDKNGAEFALSFQ